MEAGGKSSNRILWPEPADMFLDLHTIPQVFLTRSILRIGYLIGIFLEPIFLFHLQTLSALATRTFGSLERNLEGPKARSPIRCVQSISFQRFCVPGQLIMNVFEFQVTD